MSYFAHRVRTVNLHDWFSAVQAVFCGTATDDHFRAVAERIRFRAYMAIAVLTSLIF